MDFQYTKPDFQSPSWRLMEFGITEVDGSPGYFTVWAEHPVMRTRTVLCTARSEWIAKFLMEGILLMRSTYMITHLGDSLFEAGKHNDNSSNSNDHS